MAEASSPGTAAARAVSEPEFSLTRAFDAPRALVFKAWTQAGHLARWWGPAGFDVVRCEMDLRPGGTFLYGLRGPDGGTMFGRWLFRDVSAPASLEFLAAFCDEQGHPRRHPFAPEWPLEMLSTLRFIEDDGRTTIALTAVPFEATPRECEVFAAATGSMAEGWKGTLDKFDAYVAGEAEE